MPLGIDATLRYALNDYTRRSPPPSWRSTRPTTRDPPRPAADADRQPGRRLDDRGHARARRLPLLRRQAQHLRQARLRDDQRPVPGRRRRLQRARTNGGDANVRRSPTRHPPTAPVSAARAPAPAPRLARDRLARLPQPLAGDAERRAGGARPRRLRLPAPAGAAGALPGDLRGAERGRLRRRQRDDPPQARRAGDRASEAARAIGAANSFSFGADGSIYADNTDAPGMIDAMDGSRPRRRERDDPRRGRHRARGGLGPARGGARELSVWNRTPERARSWRGSSGRAVREAPGADLLVNCTSVGLATAPNIAAAGGAQARTLGQ